MLGVPAFSAVLTVMLVLLSFASHRSRVHALCRPLATKTYQNRVAANSCWDLNCASARDPAWARREGRALSKWIVGYLLSYATRSSPNGCRHELRQLISLFCGVAVSSHPWCNSVLRSSSRGSISSCRPGASRARRAPRIRQAEGQPNKRVDGLTVGPDKVAYLGEVFYLPSWYSPSTTVVVPSPLYVPLPVRPLNLPVPPT